MAQILDLYVMVGRTTPEYICIIKLLYIASLPELLAQFLATVNAAAGGQS